MTALRWFLAGVAAGVAGTLWAVGMWQDIAELIRMMPLGDPP